MQEIANRSEIFQKCDNMAWKFRTYKSSSGRNDVQDAVDGLRDDVLEHFLGRVRYLVNTPNKLDWHEPQAKKLKGVAEIYEIRFKANNVQYRPFGYFGPSEEDITILVWATKKDEKYKPANAIDTADTRREQVKDKSAESVALQIDGEDFPPPP